MNKKQKLLEEKKYESLIDFNSMSKKKYGYAKCWKNVSYDHWRVMADIVWKLVNEYEMNVLTEVVFKKQGRKKAGRADIFAYSGNLAVIIEVLNTEEEKRFNLKKSYYPEGITLMKVRTKDFKLEEFDI